MTASDGSNLPVLPQPPGWLGWKTSTGWVTPLPWTTRQGAAPVAEPSVAEPAVCDSPSTSVRSSVGGVWASGSTMFLLALLIVLWLLLRR